eukprot:13521598-Alexandrium_andersonii.AAC.1
MADSPRGQGRTPSTVAHWGPPYSGRDRSDRATVSAAQRRPTLLCESIFAHSLAPVCGRP